MTMLTLNEFITNSTSVVMGLGITALLFFLIPYISGTRHEAEQKPVMVFNSINLYKKVIDSPKKPRLKKKPIPKKPKKKNILKKPEKIKKRNQKVVKKKKSVDKLFATQNQKIEKSQELSGLEELPVAEPIYRVSEKPHFLLQAKLKFPEDMRALGKTAVVLVDVLIDSHGKVRKVTIFKSAGKSFDEAAIRAIKDSVFTPGKIAGKPCAVILRLPMRFNLK